MAYENATLISVIEHGYDKNITGVFAATKRNGEWIKTSPEEFKIRMTNFARGLLELGVKPGDRVSIHAENSTEWLICDQAILSIGAVVVPIYTTQPAEQIKYILENSECRVHIVSNDEIFAETKPLMKSIKNVKAVISLHGSKHEQLRKFDSIIELGEASDIDIDELRDNVKPDDLATLIYTSGTTGVPKGVQLTHNNIAHNVLACLEHFPFSVEGNRGKNILSYLPLAHMFERTASYIYTNIGYPIYYIEDVKEIRDDFAYVKPVYFVTVPRLLEKIVTGIKVKGQDLKGVAKILYYWAINKASKHEPENKPGGIAKMQYALADKLVYSKVRSLFGGNLVAMNVGGAALSPSIMRFVNGIGIYCGLGYGLTETSPVLTGPTEGKLRIGSSGRAFTDVQLRIAEDGEIQAKGPNVMNGYFKMPEKTKEAFTEDGWFQTGDIGHIDEDGWLFVTDRKKSLFKLSTGKYVAPQPLENALVTSGFIDQAAVIGSEHRFCGALIVPSWDNLKKRFKDKGHDFPESEITKNKYVISRIQKEVDKVNEGKPQWEQIKKFALLEKPFSIDKGEITPTLKIKRPVIREHYKDLIDEMYANEGSLNLD